MITVAVVLVKPCQAAPARPLDATPRPNRAPCSLLTLSSVRARMADFVLHDAVLFELLQVSRREPG